jgi:hypothetical protein
MPRIETTNPCLLVFLVDQSWSMEKSIGGGDIAKKDALASAVNQYLYKLARFKCRKPMGDSYIIRPRFHIALIGYSDDRVYSAFEGPLQGRTTVPIDELAASPVEIARQVVEEDGIQEESAFPVWLKPVAKGSTPMHSAVEHAELVINTWLSDWPALTVPPIVLNITDAKYSSGLDPTPAALSLTDITVQDRNVLLFNLHLSEDDGEQSFCPDTAPQQSEWARLLFNMSSELTPEMCELAREKGHHVADHARGFAFNASFAAVFDFLDIGTIPTEQPAELPVGSS